MSAGLEGPLFQSAIFRLSPKSFEIDRLLALKEVQPLSDVLADTEAPRRFNTDLITSFALGALLLAFTGIHAVVAFSVSLRTQEIAIRIALPILCSERALLVHISLGPHPWLHPLLRWSPSLVRGLHSYCCGV
jgi:hypothetical protein